MHSPKNLGPILPHPLHPCTRFNVMRVTIDGHHRVNNIHSSSKLKICAPWILTLDQGEPSPAFSSLHIYVYDPSMLHKTTNMHVCIYASFSPLHEHQFDGLERSNVLYTTRKAAQPPELILTVLTFPFCCRALN